MKQLGIKLGIRCHGDKTLPPLVMLHGFLGTKDDWQPLLSYLTTHFYCVCIDLPGHGDSAQISLPTPGFNQCCHLILTQLESIGIDKFYLLGYSLGGRIALHLADMLSQRDNQVLLGLLLESCHPGLTSDADKAARLNNDKTWAEKLEKLSFPEFLADWYQQGVFADLTLSERETLIRKRQDADKYALLNCYLATSLARQNDLKLVVDNLPYPCGFFVGENDDKFSVLAAKWQKDTSLQVISIQAAGHNVHLAQPKALAGTIIGLLSTFYTQSI